MAQCLVMLQTPMLSDNTHLPSPWICRLLRVHTKAYQITLFSRTFHVKKAQFLETTFQRLSSLQTELNKLYHLQ